MYTSRTDTPLGKHLPWADNTPPIIQPLQQMMYIIWNAFLLTRMHSSRMCTVRCSGHCREGGLPGGVCPGVCLPGRCLPGGYLPGRCLPRGVSARGVGVYPSMHWGRHPPVNRITDACENITFPQLLLRTVKIALYCKDRVRLRQRLLAALALILVHSIRMVTRADLTTPLSSDVPLSLM